MIRQAKDGLESFHPSTDVSIYWKVTDYVRMLGENRKWPNHLIVFQPDSWFRELSETRSTRNFLIEMKRCGKPFTLIDSKMGKHNVSISFLGRLRPCQLFLRTTACCNILPNTSTFSVIFFTEIVGGVQTVSTFNMAFLFDGAQNKPI